MKLGDQIKLHIEYDDNRKTVDGEFIVIGISCGLPHCFSDDCWSEGFNSFEYGKYQDGRPDIVAEGSIYVPTPQYLNKTLVKNLFYDKKTVSWEVLNKPTKKAMNTNLIEVQDV